MISVLIADDQALVRSGFTMILNAQADIEVVGEASDGLEAARMSEDLRPDVVLMDIRMPRMDGIEATRRITGGASGARILILTTFDLDEYVYEAVRAGASGFLLKDVDPGDLLHGVRTVSVGDALLAPTITRRLLERFVKRPKPGAAIPPEMEALTDREVEVLRLLARGLSNREIAAELFLSEATVKTHVTRILTKLNVRDRVQAIVLAYEVGLVQPGHTEAET